MILLKPLVKILEDFKLLNLILFIVVANLLHKNG